jgi:hypothetical protein
MAWIAAEFEDVPLRDSHVLKQSPGGMGQLPHLFAAQLRWQIRNRLVDIQMGAAAPQKVQQMLA